MDGLPMVGARPVDERVVRDGKIITAARAIIRDAYAVQ